MQQQQQQQQHLAIMHALGKRVGATAVLLCSLVSRSRGYAAVPGALAVPTTHTTHSRLSSSSEWNGRSNGHLGNQFAARGGGGVGGSVLLGAAAASRGRTFETAATLRGGAMALPGLDAAKAAIAAISVPAISWTGGPALFASVSVFCLNILRLKTGVRC